MSRHNTQVTNYIDSLDSPQREVCQTLRELILEQFADLREEFKHNYPAYCFERKRICSIGGFKRHAHLELDYGAHLRDTKGRVEGVGKNIRHVKIRGIAEIDEEYFVDLLRQSLALHKQR